MLSQSLSFIKQYYFLHTHILGKYLTDTSSGSLLCSMALLRAHLLCPPASECLPSTEILQLFLWMVHNTAHNTCDCFLAFGTHVLPYHLICNSLEDRDLHSVCVQVGDDEPLSFFFLLLNIAPVRAPTLWMAFLYKERGYFFHGCA